MSGWNNLLMPTDSEESQILDAVGPLPGEIVVTKTTDSALTGTNLRLVLSNMGIRHVVVTGIYTDQCVSSTVRSLAAAHSIRVPSGSSRRARRAVATYPLLMSRSPAATASVRGSCPKRYLPASARL